MIKKDRFKLTDKNQLESKELLRSRAVTIHRWKSELEHDILKINEEIELIDELRRRVRKCLQALTIPDSISNEFLRIRSNRMEPDLVRDELDELLVKVS